MPKNKKYTSKVSKINLISILFAIVVLLVFVFIIISNSYTQYKKDILDIKQSYIQSQKKFIMQETKRVLKYIEHKHRSNKNKSIEQLKNEIVDVIEHLRDKADGTGYVFIYTFDGINIADPILKENKGKNLLNFKDPNGKKVIYDLIEISKNKDGGYVNYVWNKPTTNTLEKKISYAISFKPWKWMIGSGVYIDNVNKALEKKEKEYHQKVIKYLYQIIILSIILFIMGYLINRYFMEGLKKSEQFANQLLESQDKFLKNSIHEINTPLSIIITNIDLYKLKYKNNKYLTKIEAGSKIIHNIYNDLAYLVKKDQIEYPIQKIDFSEFLRFRVDFFDEIAIGNNLQFNSNIEDNIFINFNDTQLQRICDNSLSNAIKYSYSNNIIDISLSKKNEFITLSIENSGNTIENIDKLFQRYYREDKARGGFGLGLNIINDICENNDIIIDVKSNNNKTIFIYKFKDIG
ncbi:MAG: cache domain-containing protein [Campylobacterota bacterium]|nr:cache domain-containing protein [Campylobacterota bacterium]